MAMERREFLKAYAAYALLGRRDPIPVPTRGRGDYSFIVLGDTHFDGPNASTYHSLYANPAETYVKEFDRNAKMWADRMPRLLKAAAARVRDDTTFVLQMGDLVQGDCCSDTVHAKMATDAFGTIKDAFGRKLPLYLTCGNHDVRKGGSGSDASKGAGPAYYACMSRLLTCEEGQDINEKDQLNYSFMRGPDLFVFANFNLSATAEYDFIKKALAAHPEARYRFVVAHGPPIPSDTTNWHWGLCNSKTDSDSAQKPRRDLRALLMANDAIVLAGHIHTTELTEIATDEGRVTQVIASSVFSSEGMKTAAPKHAEPAEYGVDQAAGSLGERVLGEYRPAMTRYWRCSTAGYMRFEVTARGITARVYGGDADSPREVWRLR